MWQYNHTIYPNELFHYGILGMKWGVRRKKKQLANRYGSVIMDLDLQMFAKRSKDVKTPRISPKEYAHVMSELRTNITKEQKQKPTFPKDIGNYTYMFENHFDDTYRIIGRKKIPQSTTGVLRRDNDE